MIPEETSLVEGGRKVMGAGLYFKKLGEQLLFVFDIAYSLWEFVTKILGCYAQRKYIYPNQLKYDDNYHDRDYGYRYDCDHHHKGA